MKPDHKEARKLAEQYAEDDSIDDARPILGRAYLDLADSFAALALKHVNPKAESMINLMKELMAENEQLAVCKRVALAARAVAEFEVPAKKDKAMSGTEYRAKSELTAALSDPNFRKIK